MGADHESTSKLILQGDASGLIGTLERAEGQVKRFNGMVDSASGTLGKFTGMMGVITGVLAGGAMFKAAAEETLKWTGEAVKLSRQLGITTEQASILNLAAGDVYISMETVSTASNALTKNSIKNKEAFEHYGITLKDSNGHQRDTMSIMQDVNAEILKHQAGRDREIVGLQLYSKSWNEVRGILKLTHEAMEDARQKAEELHLIVGPEAVARSKAYKASMNDVQDIVMSLKIQVGNHLLPILTNLGVWFNDVGPTALFLFEGALKGIMTLIHSATLGVEIFWEMWKAVWGQFSTSSVALVQIITQIISGDFAGAWATAKQGWADFNQYGATAMDNIIAKSTATNDQLQRLWGLKLPKAKREEATDQGGGTDTFEKEKISKLLSLEDAKLKTLLQGYQRREQAIKAGNVTLTAEEEFYYAAGITYQREYNDKKYELQRQALMNTSSVIDEEIAAIESSQGKKLAIAKDPTEIAKIKEQGKQETAAKIAEKKNLRDDLYQLDLHYFSAERELLAQAGEEERAQTRLFWIQASEMNKQALDNVKDARAELGAVNAETALDLLGAENIRYERLQERLFEETVLRVQTANQVGASVTAIYEQYDAQQELNHQRHLQNTKKFENAKLGYAASGFSSMASIADSFYQLSGKQSKAAFKSYQVMKSGEIVVTTADTAMKSYNAMSSIPYVGPALGAAAAIAAGLAGAAQLSNLWSASPDSASTSIPNASSAGSYGSSGAAPVTQPVLAAPVPKESGPVINLRIYGNVVDHDKFARELIPSLQLALADGVHHG